jgi:adenine deaminase
MLTMGREQRTEVIQTALGKVKADVVLAGGQLVNVYSGEILPDLWVS